ncbi:MAG: stage V sporulation protein AD, partial [Clostridia bacterium]|nr:stage V sporulation protein AD [Clostridia bacterium]
MPQSILHPHASILAAATVVGSKEHDGPLGAHFDYFGADDRFGQSTWEKAESEMQRMALAAALAKAEFKAEQVDMLFAGDLLNQCVGSSYGLLSYDIPYFGLYGACSTSAEGLLLASAMIGGGHASVAAAVTSSHNAAAERQFRSPLEYGGQRTPTSQWTATASGAC